MDLPSPPSPLPDEPPRPRRALAAALSRIDGWGPLAWREIQGWWDLGPARLLIEPGEEAGEAGMILVLPDPAPGLDPVVVADGVLRRAWAGWLARPAVATASLRPDAAIRPSTACWIADGCIHLRGAATLPMRGMTIDVKPVRRWLRQLTAFARDLPAIRMDLARTARAVAVARALRTALPAHGLCAFLAAGSRLVPGGRPLRVPRALTRTIDLGPLGRHRGWGIPAGATALVGAPYHGKSTVLAALAAGGDDHPPGDGRERVVALPAARVPSDEGRRIHPTDLRRWFARLPGGSARFATERASGATSQAAGIEQALAAGTPLLLIDEDTAAANALSLDPGMRALLGRDGAGTTTLAELLPAIAAAGRSVVTVVGAAGALAAAGDRIVRLHRFQPAEATARARRLLGPAPAPRPWRPPRRLLVADPEALFRQRLFVPISGSPDRPRILDAVVDLRRCGWDLDDALLRGAVAAAAWAVHMAGGQPAGLADLGPALDAALDRHGPRALDPYGDQRLVRPPWALVAALLERMPGVLVRPG